MGSHDISSLSNAGLPTASSTASTPKLDDTSIPQLPPPSAAGRTHHIRSRTTIDVPLYSQSSSYSRSSSPAQSPNRSSTFLPSIFTSSRSTSPLRTTATPAEAAEFAEDHAEEIATPLTSRSASPTRRRAGTVDKINSWFEGSSEPITFGIGVLTSPKKEKKSFYEVDDHPNRPDMLFSASADSVHSSTPTRPKLSSANSSRFSFFTRKPSIPQLPLIKDDLSLFNVEDALFPDGPVNACSPDAQAFQMLRMNAETALKNFQSQHDGDVRTIKKLTTERNNTRDELEASNMRAEHLQAQLIQLADANTEMSKEVAILRKENEQLRANEAALRSIRVINDTTDLSTPSSARRSRRSDFSEAGSMTSSITEASISQESTSNVPEDQMAASIHIADLSQSPGTSACPSPTLRPAPLLVKHVSRNMTPSPQALADYERAQSMQASIVQVQAPVHSMNSATSNAFEAWAIVETLRAEAASLKTRVAQLEAANQDATDLLSVMGLS